MLDSARLRIILLAENGFHGKVIQKKVRQYDGQLYSLATIYKVVRDTGFRIRDYRDGIGGPAKRAFGVVGKDLEWWKSEHSPAKVQRTPIKEKKSRKGKRK